MREEWKKIIVQLRGQPQSLRNKNVLTESSGSSELSPFDQSGYLQIPGLENAIYCDHLLFGDGKFAILCQAPTVIGENYKIILGIYDKDNQLIGALQQYESAGLSLYSPVIKLAPDGNINIFYSIKRDQKITIGVRKINSNDGAEMVKLGLFNVDHTNANPSPEFMVEVLSNGYYSEPYCQDHFS